MAGSNFVFGDGYLGFLLGNIAHVVPAGSSTRKGGDIVACDALFDQSRRPDRDVDLEVTDTSEMRERTPNAHNAPQLYRTEYCCSVYRRRGTGLPCWRREER